MSKVTGVVEKVGSVKSGRNTFWNIVLEGDDTLYRTGFDKANVEIGDEIEFSYEEGKFGWQVDNKSITVLGKGMSKPKEAPSSKPKAGGKVKEDWEARDKYWANKEIDDKIRQNIISYQAAFNTATAIVTTIVNNGGEHLLGKTEKNKIPNLTNHIKNLSLDLLAEYLRGDEVAKSILSTEAPKVKNDTNNNDKDKDLDD